MNYEDKYNKTIESIKRIYEQADSFGKELMEKEFPELRESEDERIRKELIEFIRHGNCVFDSLEQKNRFWAWLEKQGEKMSDPRYSILAKLIEADDIYQMSVNYAMVEEAKNKSIEALSNLEISKLLGLEKQCEQKTEIEYIYPKFRIGDVIVPIKPNGYYPPVRVLSIEKKTKSYYCESDDHKHYSSIPIRCENEYKLVEKNLAWSEEDENIRQDIISGLKAQIQSIYAHDEQGKAQMNNRIDWLKSLKPQNHWKPTEKQLNAIIVADTLYYAGHLSEWVDNQHKQLKSLYNDLKKTTLAMKINAKKLKEKIESISLIPQTSSNHNDGRDDMKMMILDIIDSLQQGKLKVDLENKFGWHNIPEETPEFGDTVIVACKNKNKEDGIWLYDLIQCWEGKWEPRENWETPLKWISVDELGLKARK